MSYADTAEAVREKPEGRIAITGLVLNPRVTCAGRSPDHATEETMHHAA